MPQHPGPFTYFLDREAVAWGGMSLGKLVLFVRVGNDMQASGVPNNHRAEESRMTPISVPTTYDVV